jgi:ATP-dependent DNA helicase DinG
LSDLHDVFAPNGRFSQALSNYRFRQGQLELAQLIEQTIERRGVLVAEAGTGIGKTWAYLVPAVFSAKKVIVSTGTRTLQDQLFSKDLPVVRDTLQISLNTALLKGRANYVCHHHLLQLQDDPQALHSRSEVIWLRQIRQFAQTSLTGDKAELASVPEEADIWNRVTSTRENCLAQDCEHIHSCFVYKARRQAQEADVVVVNHALYMADVALREQGITDLLPQADVVIFDEAHQLPGVATRFLGHAVSSAQWLELARHSEAKGLAHARESALWSELANSLTTAVKQWRLSLDWVYERPNRRVTPSELLDAQSGLSELRAVNDHLCRLQQALAQNEDRHPDLAALSRTAQSTIDRLEQWLAQCETTVGAVQDLDEGLQRVYWIEVSAAHARLNMAPLTISQAFSAEKQAGQAWIFVSATLSVKRDFSHFIDRLGLVDPHLHHQSSPFDYERQAVLCVPQGLPMVHSTDYAAAFTQSLMPLLQACEGNALILCTTLRAVGLIAQSIRLQFEQRGLTWPVLEQGVQPRRTLLEAFRQQPNAVLVGSASFWEGIDVVGERLTLVAIDKLPFAPPDDPVMEARVQACRDAGGNPFMAFQVPEAAITLKQGAGRLIRSESDWGVLLVGDARLVDKPYGRSLWQGLPPFRRTRQVQDAVEFVLAHKQNPSV